MLVPSLTFVASFQAISGAGAVPVACDARLDTATIDLADAEKRLTPCTKAIMPVHYASNPVNLDGVYAFAEKHGLRVIEDAGCIVASDQAVAEAARDGRLLSVEKDTEKRFSGQRSWEFDVERQGWRYHMSNIMAAIGRVQLARLDGEFAPKRRELADLYRERLSGVPGVALLTAEPEAWIVPHIFPVRILNGRRHDVIGALDAQGIPTGQHYKPNHLLSLYGGGKPSLPVTEQLHGELLTLPLHPGLSREDVESVCAGIIEAVK